MNKNTYEAAVETINNQPTAYDVDKVVERLENESKRWEDSGKEYEDMKEIGIAEGFLKAIEIVQKGCL